MPTANLQCNADVVIIMQIQEQVDKMKIEEVDELILDYTKIPTISKEIREELGKFHCRPYAYTVCLEKYGNLLILSLNDCELTDLDNLPILPKLLRLELSNNLFPAKYLRLIVQLYPNLASIALTGFTSIASIDDLMPLKELKNLMQLDVEGTEFAIKNDDYRLQLFELFPTLKYVDNLPKNGEPTYFDEEKEGKSMHLLWGPLLRVSSPREKEEDKR